MKKSLLALCIFISSFNAFSQSYFTKSGKALIKGGNAGEMTEGQNHKVNSFLDVQSGEFACQILMKNFELDKGMNKPQFNSMMETQKYPKAEFDGKLVETSTVNFKKNGSYTAKIEGELKMHGSSQKVTSTVRIEVTGDKLKLETVIPAKLEDFNIERKAWRGPETLQFSFDMDLEPMTK